MQLHTELAKLHSLGVCVPWWKRNNNKEIHIRMLRSDMKINGAGNRVMGFSSGHRSQGCPLIEMPFEWRAEGEVAGPEEEE